MEIHYRSSKPVAIERAGDARYHAGDELFLQACDVLVLACAATPDTRHHLNAQRLSLLPPHAIVVNVARGAVADDDALIGALARGDIAGAGLDVFDNEPTIDHGI
jgi:lactate dehydrogenase-like 2-hydroxyacid dehydrogenase